MAAPMIKYGGHSGQCCTLWWILKFANMAAHMCGFCADEWACCHCGDHNISFALHCTVIQSLTVEEVTSQWQVGAFDLSVLAPAEPACPHSDRGDLWPECTSTPTVTGPRPSVYLPPIDRGLWPLCTGSPQTHSDWGRAWVWQVDILRQTAQPRWTGKCAQSLGTSVLNDIIPIRGKTRHMICSPNNSHQQCSYSHCFVWHSVENYWLQYFRYSEGLHCQPERVLSSVLNRIASVEFPSLSMWLSNLVMNVSHLKCVLTETRGKPGSSSIVISFGRTITGVFGAAGSIFWT